MAFVSTRRVQRSADDDSGVSATTIAAPGGSNVKGAYTTLWASTPFDAGGIWFQAAIHNGDAYLFDVAVGSAGNEVDVFPNGYFEPSNGSIHGNGKYFIPLKIRRGVRVSCRYQRVNNNFFNVKTLLMGQDFEGAPTRWKDWGTDTANSRGTSQTSGSGVKSAYTQLVASTDFTTRYIIVNVSIPSGTLVEADVDIAVGAPGSEVVILPNLGFTNENLFQLNDLLPFCIPQGSRLSFRSQASGEPVACSIHGGA